jgi:uncharacterized protein YcbK (DUF882 family)
VASGVSREAPLFPEPPKRHRVYRGLVTTRQERIFHWISWGVIVLFMAGWVGAVVEARRQQDEVAAAEREAVPGTAAQPAPPVQMPGADITSRVLDTRAQTAFIDEAMLSFLDPLRGESGEVNYIPTLPGKPVVQSKPGQPNVIDVEDKAGIYKLAVELNKATRAVDDLSIVTLVPISQKRGGKIGLYYLGNWPWEQGGKPRGPKYAPPSGFIEVTRENQDFHVSEHFRLRDFLTKDQPNVWPKYLLLDADLIDKLELVIQELEARGVRVQHMQVMSGFRTPRYNSAGGNTEGRANLSRHMYGDASDIFVDNDRNGMMDDLNRDGRVNVKDAEVIGSAAERVEAKHRALVGGVGIYPACCGHGPFTHIDVRGYRARWRGSGNG